MSVRIPLAKASVRTVLNLKEATTCNSTIFLKCGALTDVLTSGRRYSHTAMLCSVHLTITSGSLWDLLSQPLPQSVCLTWLMCCHSSSFLWLSSNLAGVTLTHIGQHLLSLIPLKRHSSNGFVCSGVLLLVWGAAEGNHNPGQQTASNCWVYTLGNLLFYWLTAVSLAPRTDYVTEQGLGNYLVNKSIHVVSCHGSWTFLDLFLPHGIYCTLTLPECLACFLESPSILLFFTLYLFFSFWLLTSWTLDLTAKGHPLSLSSFLYWNI